MAMDFLQIWAEMCHVTSDVSHDVHSRVWNMSTALRNDICVFTGLISGRNLKESHACDFTILSRFKQINNKIQ